MRIPRRALLLSLALHVVIIAIFTLGAGFSPERVRHVAPGKQIVEAKVVDNQAVQREIEKLKAAERRKQEAEERRARELADQAAAEQKRLEKLKAEQEKAKRAQAEAKRKQAEAEKRAREAKAREEEAAARRAEAEAAAERERKALEAKRAAEEAARKKREAEAREAERRRLEKALQDELAAEEAVRQAAAQAEADRSEIDRYVAAIAARVRQSFTILPGLDGLSCTLRIRLIPGGEVAAVEIVKSSGNPTFDRQAETAVRKASPLPVPTDPRLFQQMRSISFVFDPRS